MTTTEQVVTLVVFALMMLVMAVVLLIPMSLYALLSAVKARFIQ